MAAGKKAVVVALAAVVAAFPAFAQVTVAKATPGEDLLLVLPQGEELTDLELAAIHGERTDIELGGGGGGLLWLVVERALSYLQSKYADAVNLAQRGITYVATKVVQHPVATDLTLSGTLGGLAGGLASEKETTAGKLTDAAKGVVLSLGTTLAGYGVKSFATRVAPPPPRVIDPEDPWTIRMGR
ncbi:hypothetical protein H5T53_05480 [Candidatus Bipolaricaulota bacterium]|nr:hypothetical protein [Candidatus Bipolaricaulota bacterium]